MSITYDPKLGNLNVDGRVVTGHAEGEKVHFEYNDDRNFPHVNIDGEVDRAVNADQSGILTVHLKRTSPWISILHQMAKANNTFPISWEDFNTNGVSLSGNNCWIQTPPDLTAAKEIENLEAQIFVPRAITQ